MRKLWYGFVCLFVVGAVGLAQEATAEKKAEDKAGFVVHDWVVMLANSKDYANADELFKSTLPNFMPSRRPPAESDELRGGMPHGMIAFYGIPEDRAEAIIAVSGDGRILGHWPPGKIRSRRVSWLDVKTTPPNGGNRLRYEILAPTHWLSPMRNGASTPVTIQEKNERFFFYDFRAKVNLPLTFEGGGKKPVAIKLVGENPLQDLHILKPGKDGWHHRPEPVIGGTNETKAIAFDAGAAPVQKREEILVQMKQQITAAGLFEPEAEVIASVLEAHAFDDRGMTVVYRLSEERMEELFPIEIYPYPDATVRYGIMILRDVDPGIESEMDDLILQLGDNSWPAREEAFRRLREIGLPAMDRLKKAVEHEDAEVAFRAERLVFMMSNKMPKVK